MKFSEIIDQASALIQRKGRLMYRSLGFDTPDLKDAKVLLDELDGRS